ncbi:MAG: tail fiber protein [Cytophagaceae bacterium]|nr:tail fiber protein [Cytophagaceae bacterium]
MSLFGVFPSQNGSQPFIGDIAIFGFNFEPNGWAYCNGQLLNIYENDALFALIGTTYGGDGQNTFGLPDLRGRVPIHKGQGSGLSSYVLGQQGGTETSIIYDKY